MSLEVSWGQGQVFARLKQAGTIKACTEGWQQGDLDTEPQEKVNRNRAVRGGG